MCECEQIWESWWLWISEASVGNLGEGVCRGWQGEGFEVTNSQKTASVDSNGGERDHQRFHDENYTVGEPSEGESKNDHITVYFRENLAFFDAKIWQCGGCSWGIKGSCNDEQIGVIELSWRTWVENGWKEYW